MKWLEELFNPINDWEIKEVIHGKWEITYGDDNITYTKTSVYEIYHSPSRNQYKLETSGYCPKEHKQYKYAVDRLDQLRKCI